MMKYLYLLLVTASQISRTHAEDPWSFIVFADPHNAETFASKGEMHPWYKTAYSRNVAGVKYIKETYGGDLVVIPGDTNSGKWYLSSFAKKLGDPSLTPKEAILKASHGCYGTLVKFFSEGGYEHPPMVSIGDHELGGNGWDQNSSKKAVLRYYRDGFQRELNRKPNGDFLYNEPIGNVVSRPVGTPHENVSYARKYKNVLFVTIDCFHDTGQNFMDRKAGLGGEGSVTVTVEGEHLEWFQNILREAQNDEIIKHIIVQAHVPILQPVRKVVSSGQFFDHGNKSEFWKAMVKYGVDLYLTGEVHATTTSKEPNSKLLQIASRGNQFNNFLRVEVGDNYIGVKAFNEVATKPEGNHNYTEFGEILVNKIGGKSKIESHGILKVLDTDAALLKFRFEAISQMSAHQVIGMKNKEHLILSEINVRNISCSESIENEGVLGQQYNAQIANIDLVSGRRDKLAGKFDLDSRFAIYGTGPHGGGQQISYNVWFQTLEKQKEMLLIHYGQVWGDVGSPLSKDKDFHMLTLDEGNPTLYIGIDAKAVPLQRLKLNDGNWHHLSFSMPKKSCLLSEVIIYVDGTKVHSHTPLKDRHIFHFTGGQMSLGGFGYSSNYENFFPLISPFVGLMDDFLLYGKPVDDELRWMTSPNYDIRYRRSCKKKEKLGSRAETSNTGKKDCKRKCSKFKWCEGYEFSKVGGAKKCTLFNQQPKFGEEMSQTQCAIVVL